MMINNIEKLREEIESTDSILIGAGAGLSAAAGFDYSGERFRKYFGDFIEKYGFTDMYTGGFHEFDSPEEHWAYWSRYVWINRYMDTDNGVYRKLYELVKDKNYFVITTNVDHCFQKAGFDKNRLFYTQGDYGLFQCSEPCHKKTYDNEDTIRKMFNEQRDMRIPSELIPRCPVCSKPMCMNLRSDDKFVEDEGWHEGLRRYNEYVSAHTLKKMLLLELGVGMNTPGIIKYPFWRMADEFPNTRYACVNIDFPYVPGEIREQTTLVSGDIRQVLDELVRN